jgi:hypothetical protein
VAAVTVPGAGQASRLQRHQRARLSAPVAEFPTQAKGVNRALELT